MFSLGFVDGGEISPQPVAEHPGLYQLGQVEAERAQRIVESGPLQMTVEVDEGE